MSPAYWVYILSSSSCLYKVCIINKVYPECSLYYQCLAILLLTANLIKTTGGQWRKALLCPPGGDSCKGVISCETMNRTRVKNRSM